MPTLFQFRRIFSALIIGCVAASVFGCSGSKGTNGAGGTGANSPAAGGQILKYALQTNPTELDPARVEDGDTIDMLFQVFEGLVQWNDKSEIVGNLAEKWDVSPDGKIYTFHLVENAKFHNGRKMTAKDFEYSLTRALLPATKSPTASTYLNDILGAMDVLNGKAQAVAGIKVIDDKTLQLTLDNRRPYFLGKLTYPTSYVVCKEAVEANGGKCNEKSLIGTGPFKLQTYQSGYTVKLTANEDYHGGKPKLAGIERRVQLDSITRQTSYESGELDLADVQLGDMDRVKKDPILSKEVVTLPRANIWYLALNQLAFEPFKKKEVRLAFAHAINKENLIKVALKGAATPATGIIPLGVPGYDPQYKGLEYNPEKARALLAQAGYPGGKGFPKLVISFRQGYSFISDGVQAIRTDLKTNLGIEVDVHQSEWTQFLVDRRNAVMPCYHLRWAADYLDPQDFLSVMLRTGAEENKVGYSNPEFDKLCDQADIESDPVKRAALYKKAERIAVEDAPWVCIYYKPDVEIHKPYIKNMKESLMGHLPHVNTELVK